MTFIARFLIDEQQRRTSIVDIPFEHTPTGEELFAAEVEIYQLLEAGGLATVFERDGWEVGSGDWIDADDELSFAEVMEED